MVHVLILALLAVFSAARASERIIGGDTAWIESYPYQVQLEYKGYFHCGGSILSKYHVLTAAHCYKPVSDLRVRAGTSYRSNGGNLYEVDKFIQHERYRISSGKPVNDIAVVETKSSFNFGLTQQPINLFTSRRSLAGTTVTVTGFGIINDWKPANQLQKVTLRILGKFWCTIYYGGNLPFGQICARASHKSACFGDSGGPLVIDNRVAGIVSWGSPKCETNTPNVFTEVAYYKDWIDKHIF